MGPAYCTWHWRPAVQGAVAGHPAAVASRAEVEEVLRAADVNLDGALSFAEFRTVMKLAAVLLSANPQAN